MVQLQRSRHCVVVTTPEVFAASRQGALKSYEGWVTRTAERNAALELALHATDKRNVEVLLAAWSQRASCAFTV